MQLKYFCYLDKNELYFTFFLTVVKLNDIIRNKHICFNIEVVKLLINYIKNIRILLSNMGFIRIGGNHHGT